MDFQTEMQHKDIIQGFRDGTPIAMGYFAVAFSLGIIAKQAGLTAAIGFVSSFFTRASAGEYGVYTLVAAQATYVEIVAMCLVVNLRYMLMSAALSQKIAPGTSWMHRVLMACCVTDEVFGISIARKGYCPPAYTYSAVLWLAECCLLRSLLRLAWRSTVCFLPLSCPLLATTVMYAMLLLRVLC